METQQKILDSNSIFSCPYLDSKALYMYMFNVIPSIRCVDFIDGEKASAAIREKYAHLLKDVYQYRYYDKKSRNADFNETLLVLNNQCILEFDRRYCYILHSQASDGFAEEAISLIQSFREKVRRKPREINLIVRNGSSIELKPMEIKRTRLDLDLYYEDDFLETDAIIRGRLNRNGDKGIVLLHGLPGTGKTTYLRHLVGRIRKRVMFLSTNIAGSLVEPEFIDLLVANPNSVLIIEDAERIIMDRRSEPNSAVSNLLNISDGLLADFLNVQLICTFNSPLTMVDSALMRKGRLIAKYEFGKLGIGKAQRLSDHLGHKMQVIRPMTIAEIANPHEKEQVTGRPEILGFRQHLMEN
jgi:hypothetical protein